MIISPSILLLFILYRFYTVHNITVAKQRYYSKYYSYFMMG